MASKYGKHYYPYFYNNGVVDVTIGTMELPTFLLCTSEERHVDDVTDSSMDN